jgi:putative ferrous iron transport protein C
MDLIMLKKYLQERRIAPLYDIALHFRSDVTTIEPMLDLWIHKKKVKKHSGSLGCRKGCCACNPATIVSYEWIG